MNKISAHNYFLKQNRINSTKLYTLKSILCVETNVHRMLVKRDCSTLLRLKLVVSQCRKTNLHSSTLKYKFFGLLSLYYETTSYLKYCLLLQCVVGSGNR